MRIVQELWSRDGVSRPVDQGTTAPQLVLAFGAPHILRAPETWAALKQRFPTAAVVGSSTAGEICQSSVLDDCLVATAIELERSSARAVRLRVPSPSDSASVGRALARELDQPGLTHVFVLSDGLRVNGSELVRGFTEHLPPGVGLTGGLSADGARFEHTHVCVGAFNPEPSVVAIGFYGSALRFGCGSLGGWDPFGPERVVTRSKGNVVSEFDGQPALDLYERYLGEHAAGLPASGLLFPLTVRQHRDERGVVRTILAVDKVARSLTFAGDVPIGHYARFMRANFDRLVDGAVGAARTSFEALDATEPDLALLVSCVGRKLVLKQRVEEEVEGVRRILGPSTPFAGFYSYGEISPFEPSARCELHNQTMTVTTLREA